MRLRMSPRLSIIGYLRFDGVGGVGRERDGDSTCVEFSVAGLYTDRIWESGFCIWGV